MDILPVFLFQKAFLFDLALRCDLSWTAAML